MIEQWQLIKLNESKHALRKAFASFDNFERIQIIDETIKWLIAYKDKEVKDANAISRPADVDL